MDGQFRSLPAEETIDHAPSSVASGPGRAIIQGSTPGLSGEINEVLRHRLRIASIVLFAGFFGLCRAQAVFHQSH